MLQPTSTKNCPGCFGESPLDAVRCEYCGRWFTPKENDAAREQVAANTQSKAPSASTVDSNGPAAFPISHQGASTDETKSQLHIEEEERTGKTNERNTWFFLIGLIFILSGIVLPFSQTKTEKPKLSLQESQYLTSTFRASYVIQAKPTLTSTIPPSVFSLYNSGSNLEYILSEDTEYIEGVSFRVNSAKREYSPEKDNQLISISYKVDAKKTYLAGFNFEAEELILDSPTSNKAQAIVTTDDCIVHSQDTCYSTAVFKMPIDVTQVSLYYVSNKRSDELKPIFVIGPEGRRFIATINLDGMGLSPLSDQTLSLLPADAFPTPSSGQSSFNMGIDSIDSDPYGIEIYTTSDDLLKIRGEPQRNEMVGQDMNGFVVKYYYWDFIYTLKYREEDGTSEYRVVEIQGR